MALAAARWSWYAGVGAAMPAAVLRGIHKAFITLLAPSLALGLAAVFIGAIATARAADVGCPKKNAIGAIFLGALSCAVCGWAAATMVMS
jgi:hypothetical protein